MKKSKEDKKMFKFWKKVLKKDRPWDFTFFYILIERKLKQIEEEWKRLDKNIKELRYTEQENDLKTIKKTRKMFKQLIEEDFYRSPKEYEELNEKAFNLLRDNIRKWWL